MWVPLFSAISVQNGFCSDKYLVKLGANYAWDACRNAF
jgi:hypothetical protein